MNEPRNYRSSTHTHGTAETHRQGNQTLQTANSGCPQDDASLQVLKMISTNTDTLALTQRISGSFCSKRHAAIPENHSAPFITRPPPARHSTCFSWLAISGMIEAHKYPFLIAHIQSHLKKKKKQEKVESVRSRKRNEKIIAETYVA